MPPVPLTSPLKNAVAGDGGLQPPRSCRIVHGPCDSYFENLAGKSVASVRRGLATVFSIPTKAQAYLNGSAVGPEYRVRAGGSLEFLVRRGRKGGLAKNDLLLDTCHENLPNHDIWFGSFAGGGVR